MRSLSKREFYHDLTNRRFRGAVDFAIKQVGKHTISKCIYLLDVFICLLFIKIKNGLMINPEVENRSICVWLLYCVINFSRSANGGVKISIKFFSPDVVFFLVHPAVLKYQTKTDLLVFSVYCRLRLAVFGRMWEKIVSWLRDSKCPSFVEVNQSTVKSKDSLYFHSYFYTVVRPWRKIIQNLRTTQM